MSDKDKRGAFTTVVISDIENNTQEVVYNSYTLPLLIYNGTDMSKLIEKIEAVPDKGIIIQNDIVFYDNTYASADDTFEYVLITLNELEGSITRSIAYLIENGYTLTPFIKGGGGSQTAIVTLTNNTGEEIQALYACVGGLDTEASVPWTFLDVATTNFETEAILYNGQAYLMAVNFSDPSVAYGYDLTGDAVYDEEMNMVLITGDCSITIVS